MKPLYKVFLRLFLLNGVLFFGLMSLWDYTQEGTFNWLPQVIPSIFFGLFMALWSTMSAKRSMEEHGISEPTEKDFQLVQTATVESQLSLEEVAEILKTDPLTKDWKIQTSGTELKARTRTTWRSWGEKITLEFTDGKIMIESRPVLKTTIYDGGKNMANIYLLKEMILRK